MSREAAPPCALRRKAGDVKSLVVLVVFIFQRRCQAEEPMWVRRIGVGLAAGEGQNAVTEWQGLVNSPLRLVAGATELARKLN